MVVVRPARPEELAEMGELTLRAYEQYRPHIGEEHWTQSYAPRLRDPRLRDGAVAHLVAEADGRLVGAVTLVGSRTDPDVVWFRFLAVAPDAQRMGVARRLMDAILGFAGERGAKTLAWKTASYMEPAKLFYEALGYTAEPDDGEIAPGVRLLVYRAQLRA